MDELIRQIIKDLGIDNKFLKNYRTYEILKENIRNKLKDIYADEILNNYTSEKMLNQVQEEDLISSYRKEKYLSIDKIISKVELHMINFCNRKKQNNEEWEEVLQKLKSDDEIWGKKNKIYITTNKVFISYDYPWQKGAVLMYLYGGTREIRITTIEEIKYPDEKNIEEKIYRYKKRERFDQCNNPIITTVKEYGKHRSPNVIKNEIDKLKKEYFDDIFENLKKLNKPKDKNVKNMIATMFLSIIPKGEENIHKGNEDLIK